MQKVELSVLIVNWNTARYLQQCIESLLAQLEGSSFEIIVVDNNSVDDSLNLLEKFEGIQIIRNNYNYGFAFANNQAFRNSSGEFVMTLNPDARLLNGAVRSLIHELKDDPLIGIAAPAVASTAGPLEFPNKSLRLFPESRVVSAVRSLVRTSRSTDLLDELALKSFDADWILGTGYICRRTALRGEFLFNEDSFLFGEEYDICQRVREAGYRIRVVPSAQIEHEKSVTFKYNSKRGKTAGVLMTVANWKARRKVYGRAAATLSNAYSALDDGMIWLLMTIWARLRKDSFDPGFLEGYWLGMTTSLKLLLMGERYFRLANERARLFFNDGSEPPFADN